MSKPKRRVTFNELPDDEHIELDTQEQLPTIANKLLTIPFHLPIVLIGMFQYGLTANVQQVMIKGYLTLMGLQLVYDYLIYNNIGALATNTTPKKKKSTQSDDNILLLILSAIIIPMILSVPMTMILILFGAPLSSNLFETFLLANHLSLIIINPLLVLFKLNITQFMTIFKQPDFFKILFKHQLISSGFMTLIGTWLGVLPIPLDWDRPWQTWPIPLLVGAYMGNFLTCLGTAF